MFHQNSGICPTPLGQNRLSRCSPRYGQLEGKGRWDTNGCNDYPSRLVRRQFSTSVCESLDRANAVYDERVQGFYPFLELNMEKAHEDLANREDARKYYELAASRVKVLV